MKYLVILILSSLLLINCSDQSNSEKSSEKTVALIDSGNIDTNEDLIVEDSYKGLQYGTFQIHRKLRIN